jgi:hypothetical protein
VPPTRRLAALVASLLAITALGLTGAPTATAAPEWAPASQATITPGVQMYTAGAQCTANFVFTDAADVYIGYAAHCAGLGAATDTNGCDAGSRPLGTPVEIGGATRPGTLAYSSWLAMGAAGETDPNACAYNDFALVRIHPDDHGRVNPSIPHWGGPTGTNTTGVGVGESVYSCGNSSLRLGSTLLSPKSGTSLGRTGGGWTHPTYTVTLGVPGDSGSAMVDGDGRATGVLSTLTLLPTVGSNNFSDLHRAVEYMRSHGGPNATLALGTEPFDPNRLPLGTGSLLGL